MFLGMALTHMLPDGVMLYATWAKSAGYAHVGDAFPLPYVSFFLGYLLVLLIDRVIARMCGHKHQCVTPEATGTTPTPKADDEMKAVELTDFTSTARKQEADKPIIAYF